VGSAVGFSVGREVGNSVGSLVGWWLGGKKNRAKKKRTTKQAQLMRQDTAPTIKYQQNTATAKQSTPQQPNTAK
jgi:membrane protein YqaA with SNARE-associated domain